MVVGHHQSDEAEGYEGAGSADACRTMHHWDSIFAEAVQESIDDDVQAFFSFLAGDVSIGPIGKLVVSNDSSFIGLGIFELEVLEAKRFLVGELFLFE